MKTKTQRDELVQNFSEGFAPTNSFASAAEPNDNTYPVRMNLSMGEPKDLPSLFGGENAGPPSNLPEQIPAATVAQESIARTYNMGPGNRSPLAGTTVEEGDNDL